MTKIIADSTCDLSPELLQGFDLTVLPLSITLADRTYADGIDITVKETYEAMRNGIFPKTSQIPYEYIYKNFET